MTRPEVSIGRVEKHGQKLVPLSMTDEKTNRKFRYATRRKTRRLSWTAIDLMDTVLTLHSSPSGLVCVASAIR